MVYRMVACTASRCHGVTVSRCHGAMVPWCHGVVAASAVQVYNTFVFTRTDVFVQCTPVVPISRFVTFNGPPTVLVPLGEDHGGVHDRFLIADRGGVVAALSTIEDWLLDRTDLQPNPEQQLLVSES